MWSTVARVVGPRPCCLHDLAHISWVGSVLYTDPSLQLTKAGWYLDDLLYVRRDLSDLSDVGIFSCELTTAGVRTVSSPCFFVIAPQLGDGGVFSSELIFANCV